MRQVHFCVLAGALGVLLLAAQGHCQISEEEPADTALLGGEQGTSQVTDSPEGRQGCVPPCRRGYICHGGQCLSKCNPPCPQDSECGENGECRSRSARSELAEMKERLRSITKLRMVSDAGEVVQGIMIRTNVDSSKVAVGDTSFVFDQVLYLVTPSDSYRLLLSAPRRTTKYHGVDVGTGNVEELYVRLWPVRMNAGVSLGPSILRGGLAIAGNFDVGLNVASKHFLGLTGSIVSTPYEYDFFSSTSDTVYPDTARVTNSDCYGFGVTYAYSGLAVFRAITLMPKVSVGYWRLDDAVSYEERLLVSGSVRRHEIADLGSHSYVSYYIKPGIELRAGHRVFGFRMHVDAFIGEGMGPVTLNFGVLFRIL